MKGFPHAETSSTVHVQDLSVSRMYDSSFKMDGEKEKRKKKKGWPEGMKA